MEINNVPTISMRKDITEMIEKIRDLAGQQNDTKALNQEQTGFSKLLSDAKTAINHVNELQMNSKELRNAYASGDDSISLSQVVIASQKSELAFEAMLTVRNKLVEAYKDVMNMPI